RRRGGKEKQSERREGDEETARPAGRLPRRPVKYPRQPPTVRRRRRAGQEGSWNMTGEGEGTAAWPSAKSGKDNAQRGPLVPLASMDRGCYSWCWHLCRSWCWHLCHSRRWHLCHRHVAFAGRAVCSPHRPVSSSVTAGHWELSCPFSVLTD